MASKSYKFYGTLLYYILILISKTMKIKMVRDKNIQLDKNYIYGFWHNKLIAACLSLQDIGSSAVLASPSKDGELISIPMEKMGFNVVRGSSGKDSVKSVIALLKLVKKGYNAGTPLDGPKGPIYEVKHGMLYLAQKSGNPIIPIGAAFDKKWIFEKTWDKIQLPKFFSKCVCVLGKPIVIPEDGNLEEYAKLIKEELFKLDKEAERELYNK
ncbi:lysophospholipid acyltransferase family protein [Cetobacterium sp. SF1]|uniref:lysophospholipid acyltransferase family protein n=1 Tax=Cetobacterium sp. SF1 TaxID=3417654 RepID=UPI003CF7E43B